MKNKMFLISLLLPYAIANGMQITTYQNNDLGNYKTSFHDDVRQQIGQHSLEQLSKSVKKNRTNAAKFIGNEDFLHANNSMSPFLLLAAFKPDQQRKALKLWLGGNAGSYFNKNSLAKAAPKTPAIVQITTIGNTKIEPKYAFKLSNEGLELTKDLVVKFEKTQSNTLSVNADTYNRVAVTLSPQVKDGFEHPITKENYKLVVNPTRQQKMERVMYSTLGGATKGAFYGFGLSLLTSTSANMMHSFKEDVVPALKEKTTEKVQEIIVRAAKDPLIILEASKAAAQGAFEGGLSRGPRGVVVGAAVKGGLKYGKEVIKHSMTEKNALEIADAWKDTVEAVAIDTLANATLSIDPKDAGEKMLTGAAIFGAVGAAQGLWNINTPIIETEIKKI